MYYSKLPIIFKLIIKKNYMEEKITFKLCFKFGYFLKNCSFHKISLHTGDTESLDQCG